MVPRLSRSLIVDAIGQCDDYLANHFYPPNKIKLEFLSHTFSNYSLIFFWTFIYSPINLDVQTWELEQFSKRSQFVYNRMGGIYREILPKSEYFSKALYTFHLAQNDLTVGYFTNKTTKQIEAYDPDPKDRFTAAMQDIISANRS